jgi:hypothetical protein
MSAAAAKKLPATDEVRIDLDAVREDLKDKGLAAKIAWVQQNVGHVEKTGVVNFGGTSFRAMQEHGLLNVLRPLWRVAGLSVTGGSVEPGAWRAENNQYFVDWAITVQNVDNPTEVMVRYYPNVGNDKGDKGLNKAMTAANKYGLQKFFQVPTQEIDDNDAAVIVETIRETQPAAVGADVVQMNSRKPSEEDVKALTAELQKGVGAGAFQPADVKNHLTAEYGVQIVAQLTKPQFQDFSRWVAEKLAGEAPAQ